MEADARSRAGSPEAGASGHPLAGRSGEYRSSILDGSSRGTGCKPGVHLNNRTERETRSESNAGSSGNGFSASRVSE